MLTGLIGISVPIVIHLLNRRTNRVIQWGAMDFIFQSLVIRNRRIQLEEALLMAARCLLLGLLALALARPFVPPGSSVPWLIVLPLILLAVVGLGVATVLQNERKWRRWIFSVSAFIIVICGLLIYFEKQLNLNRFGGGERQDIAIIIDGSTSMNLKSDGISNFQRAVDEAREIIKRAPRGHAFSLIIGGPSPSAKILEPTTDRSELNAKLDDAKLIDGSMAAYHSLTLASLSLARGDNPTKQILLLTDGQNVGWQIGQNQQWNFLREAFNNLTSPPRIILRKLTLPTHIRNIAITDISFSREIVGIDRPVDITVTVENTGNESITPAALDLKIAELTLTDNSLGQIAPGATSSITFTHKFKHPGAQSVAATITTDDQIPQDNVRHFALNIAGSLSVLLLDGRPDGRFLERAASFPALALAPIHQIADSNKPSADANGEKDTRFLVDPTVLPITKIATITNFDNYDLIIMADVSRLPKNSAQQIAAFVQAGGGLLVAPGQSAQPDFYNQWLGNDGQALLPAKLADQLSITEAEDSISPSIQSLRHPAFKKIAQQQSSDFSTTQFNSYWKLEIEDSQQEQSQIGARLNNGDPYLTGKTYGNGRILQLASSLDNSTGNLPTRHSYLPFIHELVYYLADPAAWDLNLDAGWELTLHLPTQQGASIGEGLLGRYYNQHDLNRPAVMTRLDANIDFDWKNESPAEGIPADRFMVEWTGKIQPPVSEEFIFDAQINDNMAVWIDGKPILSGSLPQHPQSKKIKLDRQSWHDIRVVFKENAKDAFAHLSWQSPSVRHQIIPQKNLRVFTSDAGKKNTGPSLATYTILSPDGSPRQGRLSSAQGGAFIKVAGDISSGLYQIEIPDQQAPYFKTLLAAKAKTIPFTVKRDAQESRLTQLSSQDFSFLKEFVTIVDTDTSENVIKILNGSSFGRELWKYLALGAFLILLIEIALSRWIALQRKTGDELTIEFESNHAPSPGFKEQLDKVSQLKS
ncbi:MAG: PA14 domain-containing protein [Verrucomicrobiales bacterium]|nr:PA14 domain-containing protein [Verrucomicrobiales bacterium]